MSPRKTGTGRLVLDTGEWDALKEEVKEEVRDEVMEEVNSARESRESAREAREPSAAPPLRVADSGEHLRVIASEMYAAKQKECLTTGPVGQLTRELRDVKQEVSTMTTQITTVQNEIKTASAMKELQERLFAKRLTLVVGGSTMIGVLANVASIIWTLIHRGH
jgi:chromosome segregation ATPase